jgi:hypothetical protein
MAGGAHAQRRSPERLRRRRSYEDGGEQIGGKIEHIESFFSITGGRWVILWPKSS